MRSILVFITCSLFLLTGCTSESSNPQQESDIQQDDQYKEIQKLKEETSKLREENDHLKKQIDERTSSNKNRRKVYERYLREQVQAYENMVNNLMNQEGVNYKVIAKATGLMKLESIEQGDQVGALTVEKVETNEKSNGTQYFASFSGEFEVTGEISPNEAGYGPGKYIFTPASIDAHKTQHLGRFPNAFSISNSKEVEAAFGDSLDQVIQNNDFVTLKFSGYHFDFIPESHGSDYSEFVGLVSEQ